jgi:excisionase family DNA binding protein
MDMEDNRAHQLGNLDPIYTAEEAAAYLRVTTRTITELARSGELTGFRVGRNWRFPEPALASYIQGHTTHPDADRRPGTGRRRR